MNLVWALLVIERWTSRENIVSMLCGSNFWQQIICSVRLHRACTWLHILDVFLHYCNEARYVKYSEQRRLRSGEEPAHSVFPPSLTLPLEGCIFGINPFHSLLVGREKKKSLPGISCFLDCYENSSKERCTHSSNKPSRRWRLSSVLQWHQLKWPKLMTE